MQHSPTEIKEKLLKAVDKEYNVLDMGTVVEVISILERTPITKEALESTRLGKYVNELRRKTTNESLAKRAKDLVRQWRHLISPIESCPAGSVPREIPSVNHQKNGLNVTSRLGGTLSPGLISRDSNLSPGLPQNNSPVVSPFCLVGGGIVANSRTLPVSPAASLASSEKSNTSPSLLQSSSVSRVVKQASCPRTPPVSQNSQTKTLRGHRPESPNPIQTVNLVLASESVPKTHVANKRLRKDSQTSDEDLHLKKISRPNGDIGNAEIDVVGDCSRDSFGCISDHESLSWDINIPPKIEVPKDSGVESTKKRGSKRGLFKGQKVKAISGENSSSSTLPSSDDIVKEKIASIARISKVKTTQELLAGLQAKNVQTSTSDIQSKTFLPTESKTSLANCVLPGSRGSPSDALEVSRNKSEHIEKFLLSQSGIDVNTIVPEPGKSLKFTNVEDSPDSADNACFKGAKDSTISSSDVIHCSEQPESVRDSQNSVLAADSVDTVISNLMGLLPPVDYSAISWSEPEVDSERSSVVFDSESLGKLSVDHMEGVNGNFSHIKTSDGVPKFCEWHEPVSRTSYGDELLAILPYVVID